MPQMVLVFGHSIPGQLLLESPGESYDGNTNGNLRGLNLYTGCHDLLLPVKQEVMNSEPDWMGVDELGTQRELGSLSHRDETGASEGRSN